MDKKWESSSGEGNWGYCNDINKSYGGLHYHGGRMKRMINDRAISDARLAKSDDTQDIKDEGVGKVRMTLSS